MLAASKYFFLTALCSPGGAASKIRRKEAPEQRHHSSRTYESLRRTNIAFTTINIAFPVLGLPESEQAHIPEGLISPMKEEQLARDDRRGDIIPLVRSLSVGSGQPD